MGVFSRAAVLMASSAAAMSLNLGDTGNIKSVAGAAAYQMMSYYNGNQSGQTPGTLYKPYYWWECGAMFGAMIDYWYYTNDTTYNDVVSEGLLFQASPTLDFMPPNQTKDEGNDDQVFWAFAAMTAAEFKFPDPPSDQPQWLTLAEAVFNSQALRWDNLTCNGGLRWQIFQFNNGYNYKNTPSNAGFMNLGARLYAYTDNSSYANWVETGWDWLEGVGLISPSYLVFDGTNAPENCSSLDHDQWTYSVGMLMHTAAVMWSKTNSDIWKQRAEGVWNASTSVFFTSDKIMLEGCESKNNCNTDQLSFKSYFARYMAASAKVAPWLHDQVMPYLQASAAAAAAQCIGGSNGFTCGTLWTKGAVWDQTQGIGQQMSALQAIQANLIDEAPAPVSGSTGGTSVGNATFGTGGDSNPIAPLAAITAGDRAGAGILTAVVVVVILGGTWWLVS